MGNGSYSNLMAFGAELRDTLDSLSSGRFFHGVSLINRGRYYEIRVRSTTKAGPHSVAYKTKFHSVIYNCKIRVAGGIPIEEPKTVHRLAQYVWFWDYVYHFHLNTDDAKSMAAKVYRLLHEASI
jgi:hypothetical protein